MEGSFRALIRGIIIVAIACKELRNTLTNLSRNSHPPGLKRTRDLLDKNSGSSQSELDVQYVGVVDIAIVVTTTTNTTLFAHFSFPSSLLLFHLIYSFIFMSVDNKFALPAPPNM
jgi:hypothetical protein